MVLKVARRGQVPDQPRADETLAQNHEAPADWPTRFGRASLPLPGITWKGMQLRPVENRIKPGWLLRINCIQAFCNAGSRASLEELGDSGGVQLAAGHLELAGRAFGLTENIVRKRNCSLHKVNITEVILSFFHKTSTWEPGFRP